MSDREVQNYLRIADPDEPIYRIFPLWHLQEAVRLNQLALVSPALWEDPFEVLPSSIQIVDRRTASWKVDMLHAHLNPVFAQCWSRTAESDTLLRAYSRVVKDSHHRRNTVPRDEGVRVRSTPRKLLRALMSQFPDRAEQCCFVGAVRYETAENIKQYIADLIGSHELAVLGRDSPRAELHLLKRVAFRHESEVRVVYVAEGAFAGTKLVTCGIDVNEVFEEMVFDPRLEVFEQRERESVIRALGYAGPVTTSELYGRLLLEVHLGDASSPAAPTA